MQPQTERPGVIEVGLEDAGILGQYILPVADPVIRPARAFQESVDQFRSPDDGGRRKVSLHFVGRRNESRNVESGAAEKLEIRDTRLGGNASPVSRRAAMKRSTSLFT